MKRKIPLFYFETNAMHRFCHGFYLYWGRITEAKRGEVCFRHKIEIDIYSREMGLWVIFGPYAVFERFTADTEPSAVRLCVRHSLRNWWSQRRKPHL